MENRVDFTQIVTGHDIGDEIFFVDIVGDVEIDQVGEFGAIFQVIYHQDIAIPCVIQRFNDIAADHAGATSDDNHWVTPVILPGGTRCPTLNAAYNSISCRCKHRTGSEYPVMSSTAVLCRDICCNFHILSR
ncbi:hypothetical protein D3C71_1623990 [compost metagenome]